MLKRGLKSSSNQSQRMRSISHTYKILGKKEVSSKVLNSKGKNPFIKCCKYHYSMAFKNTYYNNMDSINLLFNNFETRDAYNQHYSTFDSTN
jgi:hypothetical protein